MGGIELIIYNNLNLNIDFSRSFMNMNHRGIDDTAFINLLTNDLINLNNNALSIINSNLSKHELATYTQYKFMLGYHRTIINDNTFDASQPFIDPIPYKITMKNRNRPKRHLICNGEIYNYNELLNNINIDDLASNSDVEIILSLYIKNVEDFDVYNEKEFELNDLNEKLIEAREKLKYSSENERILNKTILDLSEKKSIIEQNSLFDNNFKTLNDDIHRSLISTLNKLDGDFTFILTENIETFKLSLLNTYAARDRFGIKPLYFVKNISNNIYIFISEIKGLPNDIIKNPSYTINHFLPGHFWSFQNTIMNNNGDFIEYYSLEAFKNLENCTINTTDYDILQNVYSFIKDTMTSVIINRWTNNVPVGILLSGGFNSSILISLLVKHLVSINHDFINNPLHVFTVGDTVGDTMDDNETAGAKRLVDYLENKYNITLHHHIIYINDIEVLTFQPILEDIIYSLESFEPKTVKESIPFYYLMKYIKDNTNVKVLLTGDGLNELGGYSQFMNLDYEQFQIKSVELLQSMYKYTLLRTDRISNRFNLEVRHPFLNHSFIEYILSIHPKLKKALHYTHDKDPVSKYILRKPFETSVYGEELLPNEQLWRENNEFCNSLTNFDLRLTEYFNTIVTDDNFNYNLNVLSNEKRINKKTLPENKEQLTYRNIFRKLFPNRDYIVDLFWNHIWSNN